MGTQFAITLTVLILLVDFIMILLTFSLKVIRTHRNKHRVGIESKIEHQVTYEDVDLEIMPPDQLMEVYVKLRENLALPVSQQEHIMQVLLDGPLPQKFIKGLKSRFYIKRAESASKLKYLENKEIQEALLKALDTERHPVVILQLAYALATQHVTKAIKPIARKLRGMNTWFSRRLRAILYSYGFDFLKFAKRNRHNSRLYMQLLICGFAREYPSEELRPCMIERALSGNGYVRVLALLALIKYYPSELTKEPFISSTHRKTLSYVIRAYGKNLELSHVDAIMSYANFTTLREQIVLTLSEMAAKDPAILTEILRRFEQSKSKDKRALYAKVLANRVEYFLTRIHSPIEKQVENLIQELVRANHVSAMLFFLNRNQDPDIEKKLFTTLKRLSSRHKGLRAQMLMYLEPQVLKRCGLKDDKKGKETPRLHAEPPQRLQLAIIFISILVFIPLVIMASEFPKLIELGWSEIGRLYVTRFNYLLVFYSVTINIIYLVMLGISLWGAHVQSRLWALKGTQFLFTKNLLPSISIIAPAFNEAASIIESTNSLLNQRYPDFELIVVNDGSRDTTLKTLIDYYKLEKRDIQVKPRLKTRALRGIYMNRSIPNLIVVDKMNGGKADSLNMGLNVASKTFFCGIDADSLLEPEALLRAVSVMIDSKEESVAAGGNICPVNGCDVERGHLDTISLPKKFLPRLQSLEYIRAFMSGRVGWAQINCLLIISGAFGIFNRDRTIKTGGYLTKSGRYQKDTVGEDMELVVRISRQMREQHIPYSVNYAFNANCWTEVPESWKVLHRQRDRWHRGLVDILLFHRKMIANPKYGRLGMVGMLYYFLFELIGPFIEAQGLIMVFVAAIIGVMNTQIALLLFTTTIFLGILVSVSSVFISELDREMYGPKDVLRLLKMAVMENFGIRQIISLWRVTGYFSSMRKSKGWGAQVRKGFSTKVTAPKGKS